MLSHPPRQWRHLLLGVLVIISTTPSRHLLLARAHPPEPQANDIFGTVYGCASALVEMDDNQDGMVKRGEYLDFVNLIADFLCLPPRPYLDLELQTVFFSIACLCQEREGFDKECCHGDNAAIYTTGAADVMLRTEDQDSYLRAACLLTQAVLGPEQCPRDPPVVGAGSLGFVRRSSQNNDNDDLTDSAKYGMIAGAAALLLLCCLLCCCACCKREEDEEESEEEQEIEIKEEVVVEKTEFVPYEDEKGDPGKGAKPESATTIPQASTSVPPTLLPGNERSVDVPPAATTAAPAVLPVAVQKSVPPPQDEEAEEGSGKRFGHSPDEDGDDEFGRKFGGEGQLPPPPDIENVQLRHIEVEKQQPGDYEYPERNIEEYKIKREDSGQILDHYVPDGGVFIPERAKKDPVVFNLPKYQRPTKPVEKEHDPRKLRKQLGYGDGEVWEALARHEKESIVSVDQKFEWVVQGALEVLAKANDSGELTKPRPRHATGPSGNIRISPTPPPPAPKK